MIPLSMWAAWGDFFSSNDDPVVNNHVNVITGKLQLSFEDHVVQGAVPLPLRRTYTNYGNTKESHSKWNFSEGWSFLSHTHLYFNNTTIDGKGTECYAVIVEMSGIRVIYRKEVDYKGIVYMKPFTYEGQNSEAMNYREDYRNHRMKYDKKRDTFRVTLADGTIRQYNRKKLNLGVFDKFKRYFKKHDTEYLLESELFPSGQVTFYKYHKDGRALTVMQSSRCTRKVFSWLTLDQIDDYPRFKIKASSSDGKEFTYHGTAIDRKCHLTAVTCGFRPDQKNRYNQSNVRTGGWLDAITSSDREGLRVEYNFSKDFKDPNSRKVVSIYEGDIKLASFNYFKEYTEVRDEDDILSRFHHKDGTLTLIEYFDKEDRLYRQERYVWENGSLALKENLDGNNEVVCSKRYTYDDHKNLIAQTICKGEENLTKWYRYNERHLLIEEREDCGLITSYEYLGDKDLITCKKTLKDGVLLTQERFKYDRDFLLIEKSCFDGYRTTYEKYTRDDRTGMIKEVDNGLTRIHYTYNGANQIVKEETEFSTMTTQYDAAGRVIKKTFPNGGVHEYLFDRWGNALEIKEVGSDKRLIEYDNYNRPVVCTMNGKVSKNTYNNKGFIDTQTDYNGSVTIFTYDAFGRCIQKENPLGGVEKFEFDILGNVTSYTAPNGAITKTTYNLFNKPKTIVYPNGRTLTNVNNQDGTLKEVLENNRLKTRFVYDGLQRMTKRVSGSLEEEWEYEGAVLKKYKDVRGLITIYDYDDHGRKIKEISEDRVKEFFYDKMGFVKEVREGDLFSTYQYDSDGRLLASSENGSNHVINEYDVEGRKISSRKMTSNGEALDQFFYDDEGSITCHIDPLGQKTLFIYEHLQCTEVDPLGNKTVTKFDRLFQEIQKQKLSADDTVLFSERFFYDTAGNVIKRITDEFGMEVEYSYDIMGNLLQELESGVKRTSYAYDNKGRLISKTSPNGVSLYYEYDDLDRKIEEKSSDHTIWHQYEYSGADLVEITDKLLERSVKRAYNSFGQLISEINFSGFKTSWYYNTFGKVERIFLPDHSSIHYSYERGHMSAIERYTKGGNLCYQHLYTKFDPNHHVEEEKLPFNLGKIHSKRDLLERCTNMQSPYHNIEHTYNPTSLVTKKINSLTGDKDYSYDDLSQITAEGLVQYDFDALGNPKDCEVNQLNELIKTPTGELFYDGNGNLKNRSKIKYSYDAFNRLKTIEYENGKKVAYTYDPLSRLATKETFQEDDSVSTKHFLYDKDYEIGSISAEGVIEELKILGLGIKGDIGAAVAIELQDKVYIPLHDLQGNVIALLSSQGKITETYKFSAFGEEEGDNYQNPWRFASKRVDEKLIFFGLRFYDPSIKRWISPDPLGFVDSRNPYLYVLNNPINRLDEFGLEVECSLSMPAPTQRIPYQETVEPPNFRSTWFGASHPNMYFGHVTIDGLKAFLFITLPPSFDLSITAQDVAQKHFNLMERLPELVKGAETKIVIAIHQNGINNTKEDFLATGRLLQLEHPPGTIIIGLCNETQSVPVDVGRTLYEKINGNTKGVRALSGLLMNLIDVLEKSAPTAKIQHYPHSEGVAIYDSMFENATKEQKAKIAKYVNCAAFGGATCLAKEKGHIVKNWYSDKDYVTGPFAKLNDPRYDVEILKSITPQEGCIGGFADHGFTQPTYSQGRKKYIEHIIQYEGGFHVPSRR
jgi:RHS repeat-associated protein